MNWRDYLKSVTLPREYRNAIVRIEESVRESFLFGFVAGWTLGMCFLIALLFMASLL